MTPGFTPDIFTDVFLHVNRCPLEQVAQLIKSEEAKGYLVNAAPIRYSSLHAVLSYQRRTEKTPNEELKNQVKKMDDLFRNLGI